MKLEWPTWKQRNDISNESSESKYVEWIDTRSRAIWKNWLFEPPVIRCLKSWEWWAFVNSLCTLVNCSRYLLGPGVSAGNKCQQHIFCFKIQRVCVWLGWELFVIFESYLGLVIVNSLWWWRALYGMALACIMHV